MLPVTDVLDITNRMVSILNPTQLRILCGEFAFYLPYGSIKPLCKVSGLSRNTIGKAKKQAQKEREGIFNHKNIANNINVSTKTVLNKSNIGRPRIEVIYKNFYKELIEVISNNLYINDDGTICTDLSLRQISNLLLEKGIVVNHATVRNKLTDIGIKTYSITNKNLEKYNIFTRDFYCEFDSKVDHFYDNNFTEPFDSKVDYFLSYDYFDSSKVDLSYFDETVDKFYSNTFSFNQDSDLQKYSDFDTLVDYFFHDTKCKPTEVNSNINKLSDFDLVVDHFYDEEKNELSDKDMVNILVFLALILRKNEKNKALKKRYKKRSRKRGWQVVRYKAGARYTINEKYSLAKLALLFILEEFIYGNPEKVILWSSKSFRKLQKYLQDFGIFISHTKVGDLLEELNVSRKTNRKFEQIGKKHPDTDAQMTNIVNKKEYYKKINFVTISIDCKKKELIGNYSNNGSDYCRKPIKSFDHDFPGEGTLKASPYGIYDEDLNEGYINIGYSGETPEFAVHSIEKWWDEVGSKKHTGINGIFITCDGGGSNGSASIRFKLKLQEFANRINLVVAVSHFPPGKSKYNKIEHRLFCYISNNWRGHPLKDIGTITEYIRNTETNTGLKVYASNDWNKYQKGIKCKNKELQKTLLLYDDYLGGWNYTFYPESQRDLVQDKINIQWENIDKAKKEKKISKKTSK